MTSSSGARSVLVAAVPVIFVLLWGTGFIGAKYINPYTEPLTFLAIRFAVAAAALTLLAIALGAPWPATWREGGHIIFAGLLLNGIYLGGVFSAVAEGVSTGVSALVVGLQPLLTAGLVGRLLGEKISTAGWVGLAIGFAGVGMVVWERVSVGAATGAGLALARVRPSSSGVGMRPSVGSSSAGSGAAVVGTMGVGMMGVEATLRVGSEVTSCSTGSPKWAASITFFQIMAG